MKVLLYLSGILVAIGFILVVWAPFNAAFRSGVKAWHPISGFKWWPRDSWYMQAIGMVLFIPGGIGLIITMGSICVVISWN
jgi:hypothetical protein